MEKHMYSRRSLAALIIPLIIDSFLSILIGMADTIMVSSNGEAAVSGVSLVDTISNLLIQLFAAFATGGAVVVAQYIGSGDKDKAKDSAKNLIYISAIVSVIMTVVVLPIRGYIIDICFGNIGADVKGYTDDYFVPILLSYPFLAIYSALTALSRAENRSIRTMLVSVMMNAINIGGNAILIFIYDLGPRGAGIASLASRIMGCIVMFTLMHRGTDKLSLQGILSGPFSPDLIKRILRIGIPSGIEGASFNIGKILVQSLTASLGTSAMAINAVMGNFNSYSNIPGNGINLAMITVIGQCRGRRNFRDISHYTKLLTALVFTTTLITVLPMMLFAPQVISIYGLEPSSIEKAIPMARLCLFMCFAVWPLGFTLPNMLKAVGDVRFIMVASFASMWLFRVAGAYILIKGLGFGVEGIWYAMYIDWIVRGLLYLWRVTSGRWKTKEVI